MAPEHEPDPLVAPRSEESDAADAGRGSAEPFDQAGTDEPEREPLSEPIGSSEPESERALSEPSAAASRSASRNNAAPAPRRRTCCRRAGAEAFSNARSSE